MKYIDGLRCSEPYSHSEDECLDDCRKRGIYIYDGHLYVYVYVYLYGVHQKSPSKKVDVYISLICYNCYRMFKLCFDGWNMETQVSTLHVYPVKTTISGLPAINYPDVCPKEPFSRTSAFCEKHCEVAKTNKVPTDLRTFLHDYCGVPRSKDGKPARRLLMLLFGLYCMSIIGSSSMETTLLSSF